MTASWPYQGPQFGREPSRTQSHEELVQAQRILDQARQETERARRYRDEARRLMSQALWCDPGDHAFSSKDSSKREFVGRYTDPEKGEIEEVINVCGEHLSESFRSAQPSAVEKFRALERNVKSRKEE